MQRALELAILAFEQDEVPIGAVIVHEGIIVGEGFNTKEKANDPTCHAEIIAIKEAAQSLGKWRLTDCTLYSTLEPCVMCAGACVQARLGQVVYGAADPKFGGVESLYQVLNDGRANHTCLVHAGVLAQESKSLLQDFFRRKRGLMNKALR